MVSTSAPTIVHKPTIYSSPPLARTLGRWPDNGQASKVAQIGIAACPAFSHNMDSVENPIQANTLVIDKASNRPTRWARKRAASVKVRPSAVIVPRPSALARGGTPGIDGRGTQPQCRKSRQ